MGFPLVSYCLAVPKPLVVFCKALSVIRDAVLLMLAVVGLCRFPYDDGSRGSVEGPKPEEVKARLPAVEYGQLVAELLQPPSSPRRCTRAACHHDGGGEEAAGSPACIVCLERLEAADEVRRLGNCAHAFHRGCIDRWIDLGRRTCPLCRSDLLPRPRGWAGSPASSRAFGEDRVVRGPSSTRRAVLSFRRPGPPSRSRPIAWWCAGMARTGSDGDMAGGRVGGTAIGQPLAVD